MFSDPVSGHELKGTNSPEGRQQELIEDQQRWQARQQQQKQHRQQHFTIKATEARFEDPIKIGPSIYNYILGPFHWIWASHAATAAKACQMGIMLLLVFGLGLFFTQVILALMSVVNSAALGFTYIGTWAVVMQACKVLNGFFGILHDTSPLALPSGYFIEYLGFGPQPVAPTISPISFIQGLGPRRCTALLGTLASIFGCISKRG